MSGKDLHPALPWNFPALHESGKSANSRREAPKIGGILHQRLNLATVIIDILVIFSLKSCAKPKHPPESTVFPLDFNAAQ